MDFHLFNLIGEEMKMKDIEHKRLVATQVAHSHRQSCQLYLHIIFHPGLPAPVLYGIAEGALLLLHFDEIFTAKTYMWKLPQ